MNDIMRRGYGSVGVILATGVVLLLAAIPASAQTRSDAPAAATKPAAPEIVTVGVGRTTIVRSPWMAKGVAVTDPKVADVQIIGPQQVLVQGKIMGVTDITLWNDRDQTWQAQVVVEGDMERLKVDLKRLFPDSSISVMQSQDVVVVTGTLSRIEQAEQLARFFKGFGVKYVDMTTVAGVQQVLLQVRMAEVNRTVIRTLGFNTFFNGSDFFGGLTIAPSGGTPLANVGDSTVGTAGRIDKLVFSPAVNAFAGFPDADFFIFMQALAEDQYLRVLAEPNLVAKSGEEANFLAGGEYPIPVVQGTSSSTAITIEYRKFGVQLRFKPVVMGDGRIRLHVAPEVSQLSDNGAVVIQGFRVPALSTRRAETTLELRNRQTFAMAGLINRQVSARNSRIPGPGDIPVLGALFRSVRYQKDETELLVLVTASLVEPLSTATPPPVPGVTHVTPNDWEFYALGKLEGAGRPRISHADAQWLREAGLHRLKGPGAWARPEDAVHPSEAPATPPAKPQPQPTK